MARLCIPTFGGAGVALATVTAFLHLHQVAIEWAVLVSFVGGLPGSPIGGRPEVWRHVPLALRLNGADPVC